MKKRLSKIIVLIFFFFITISYSQSRFSHEAGLSFGVASLQTDFGESRDFESANASTFSFGVAYYLKFFGSQYDWRSGSTYFSQHFKLKAEFDYLSNSNIQHKGATIKGNSDAAQKLRAMKGTTRIYDIGTSFEFYFFELEDYTTFNSNKKSLNPYLSIGLHYSFYDPDILVNDVSLEGQEEPYTQLIPSWQTGAVYTEPDATLGLSFGAGLRYSIEDIDLVFDTRWQHFFSDQVDGLDPSSAIVEAPVTRTGDKYNDTMIVVNVGIVYVFGQNW